MTRAVMAALLLFAITAPPHASAQKLSPSRADKRLKADVLRGLQRYSVAAFRCARLRDVQAASLPKSYRAASPVYRRGGHWEAWSARVCGKRRSFAVAMWPGRRGGVDFTIEPRDRGAKNPASC